MAERISSVTRLSSWGGIATAILFVGGSLGARTGMLSPLTGFALFLLGGLVGFITLILGLIAWARAAPQNRAGAVRGTAIGGLVTMVFVYLAVSSREYPRINDITTDLANPPEFIHAPQIPENLGRDMTYPATFAAQQQAAYPDLAPLVLTVDPDRAFATIRQTARQMPAWEVTYEEPEGGILEAVATSALFRFQDDILIRVQPRGDGSMIDMRSKSRDGRGDIGVNAARIRTFFAAVQSSG